MLVAVAIGTLHVVYQLSVPVKTVPTPQEFPQPRIDTSQGERAARERLTAAQQERLETWRWADDRHTLVQIPIERAMALLAQKGGDAYAPLIAAQPALSSPTSGAQRAMTPQVEGAVPPRGQQR